MNESLPSSATLTSIAMLKLNNDRGADYLDYLRPFVQQVLVDHRPDPVTDHIVRDHVLADFGLEIPSQTIQIVLKRLSRDIALEKDHGKYQITGEIEDTCITASKVNAERHINAIIDGLVEFSRTTIRPIESRASAIAILESFLARFGVDCLKAYLRGSSIPNTSESQDNEIAVVSNFLMSLQSSQPERFESFIVLVQGHMYANALMCPDLINAPKSYRA
ncbi:hypothetical protein AB1L30_18130 [Bremerella sp. JC817]|uniref:hypothetical protein n=1 Tax=Bremerella sp. JC817 TaxID=3231756 RepID=UPI0034589018